MKITMLEIIIITLAFAWFVYIVNDILSLFWIIRFVR